MAVIEIEGLRKEYRRLRGGRTLAVAGLDLTVPEGGVFGFLGPNGAGKTTAIRCLLGLVRPTSGSCTLLGADTQTQLASVIPRVGAIVETPTFFPRFSGRRNLELLGALQGIGPRAVTDALATGHRAGLRVRLDDLPAGLEVLRSAGIAADPDGDAIRVTLPVEESARITRALAERGLYLSELRPEEVDLETVF